MHHPVPRDELLDVILHKLLEFQGQIAEVQIAFFIIPGNDLCAWAFLRVFADPCGDLTVDRAGGDKRSELVVINLSEL